jgi:hypothetical protein
VLAEAMERFEKTVSRTLGAPISPSAPIHCTDTPLRSNANLP